MAQAPATCGAAIEVPLAVAKPPLAKDDTIESPGAKSDMKGATFEKPATRSAFVVAPTLMADGIHAGELRAFVAPLFPAEMTVAMPADWRLSMIAFSGSVPHGWVNRPAPRLRFAAAKFRAARRV